MADDKSESEIEASEESEQETSLLPRSFFQGKDLEIGSTCKIKVEGIFDEEVEVSYVKHKKKDKDGKDKDSDDSDDKPCRHRDSDAMRESMREFDAIAPVPAPAPGGYY